MDHGSAHDLAVRTALFEASADAILTTDRDGAITSWSSGAERLYGYTAAEIVGRPVHVLYPGQVAADERRIADVPPSHEPVRNLDAMRRRRDGTLVRVALTLAPLVGGDGTVLGTLRVARDLSPSEMAARAARRLAAIVESSDDAIVSKDLDGIVTSWNRAAERMFGYTAGEMIGRSIRTIIPADRQSEEDHVLATIRGGGRVEHFETIRQQKDGSLIPISLTVSPIRDTDGHIIGASKIARDISARRQAEIERSRLLAAAEQNAAITDRLNAVGAVVASGLDRAQIVQAVTDAATELTGAEFGAFLYHVTERGEPRTLYAVSGAPREAFSKYPLPRDSAVFAVTLRDAAVVCSEDITRDPRYGRNAPYHGIPPGHLPVRSYLAVPVKSRSGEVLGGLFFGHAKPGVFQQAQERLAAGVASWAAVALENARLYADAQEASRLKDEFLATLSHELRTPLNAILGYTRMISGGILPPERHAAAVAIIERNAKSLAQIIEDVLDVSRIISGRMRLDVRRIDITEVVNNAVDAVRPAAEAKRIELDVVGGRVPMISGDSERLQQVVWNLVSNAVKFTPAGGRVEVDVRTAGSDAEVVVRDNGMGIPASFLPHVFERFRQADSATTREKGGLGLGLAIVRQLVEMHGGTVEAESAGTGLGATFRVRLPSAAARAANARSRERHPDEPRARAMVPLLNGVRILVVDDDEDALLMAREILEVTGAEVVGADSADAALDALRAFRPDVVVADLGMPRVDGFELIRRIRQVDDAQLRQVPAVALTAYALSDDRAKALRCGFQVHLSKPIDPPELMSVVARLAGRGEEDGAGDAATPRDSRPRP